MLAMPDERVKEQQGEDLDGGAGNWNTAFQGCSCKFLISYLGIKWYESKKLPKSNAELSHWDKKH